MITKAATRILHPITRKLGLLAPTIHVPNTHTYYTYWAIQFALNGGWKDAFCAKYGFMGGYLNCTDAPVEMDLILLEGKWK